MRRLLRILFNIATALSLVLFLAIVVVWWRGRTRHELVQLFRESLDDHGLRQIFWTIESSGSDLSVSVDWQTTDAQQATAAGCVPGVRSGVDADSLSAPEACGGCCGTPPRGRPDGRSGSGTAAWSCWRGTIGRAVSSRSPAKVCGAM